MINTLNLSLAEAEDGKLIRFPRPANLIPDTIYNVYFDNVASFPANPPSTISFIPNGGSYSILGSSIGSPTVFVSIKSSHIVQTKTLIRLTIKNTSNAIVYTDYLLITASPSDTLTFEGTILPTSSSSNFGPNNGRILQIINYNQATNSVSPGDIIQGPGIPETILVSIQSVLSASRIELLETPLQNGVTIAGTEHSGIFTIIRQVGCVNPLDQEFFQLGSQYTVLDYSNNWTYYIKNKILVKLVIDDLPAKQDTIMLLPVKNVSLVSNPEIAPNIPALSVLKIAGRVDNESIPVTDL